MTKIIKVKLENFVFIQMFVFFNVCFLEFCRNVFLKFLYNKSFIKIYKKFYKIKKKNNIYYIHTIRMPTIAATIKGKMIETGFIDLIIHNTTSPHI